MLPFWGPQESQKPGLAGSVIRNRYSTYPAGSCHIILRSLEPVRDKCTIGHVSVVITPRNLCSSRCWMISTVCHIPISCNKQYTSNVTHSSLQVFRSTRESISVNLQGICPIITLKNEIPVIVFTVTNLTIYSRSHLTGFRK